jgi:hypothetical protein
VGYATKRYVSTTARQNRLCAGLDLLPHAERVNWASLGGSDVVAIVIDVSGQHGCYGDSDAESSWVWIEDRKIESLGTWAANLVE